MSLPPWSIRMYWRWPREERVGRWMRWVSEH